MKAVGDERLTVARAALRAVENSQGMRSYRNRSVSSNQGLAGVYHLGHDLASLLKALQVSTTSESWVALLRLENFGWEAAAAHGLDLEKVLVVECEDDQVGMVVSILLESVNIVVVGDSSLSIAQQRSLQARVRKLERVLFTTNPWPSVSKKWVAPASADPPATNPVLIEDAARRPWERAV